MAKEYFTNNTGASQTLNASDQSKIKIYDSKTDMDTDISNIAENEIVATKAGESEGANLWFSGIIIPFGGTTAPTGWLICDGRAISRADYASLFSAIGTAFGTGDGSTTFNIPDLREATVKGAGLTGLSNDHYDSDGIAVGEFVEDRVQEHTHALRNYNAGATQTGYTVGTGEKGYTGNAFTYKNGQYGSEGRYGDTTEVKAVGVNFIIKA